MQTSKWFRCSTIWPEIYSDSINLQDSWITCIVPRRLNLNNNDLIEQIPFEDSMTNPHKISYFDISFFRDRKFTLQKLLIDLIGTHVADIIRELNKLCPTCMWPIFFHVAPANIFVSFLVYLIKFFPGHIFVFIWIGILKFDTKSEQKLFNGNNHGVIHRKQHNQICNYSSNTFNLKKRLSKRFQIFYFAQRFYPFLTTELHNWFDTINN